MAEKFVVGRDGTQVKVPQGYDDYPYVQHEDGSATVAMRIHPSQIKEFYAAATELTPDVYWAEGSSFFNTTLTGDDYDSDHQTRYDLQHNVDPQDTTPKGIHGQIEFLRNSFEWGDPLFAGIVSVMSELTAGRVHLEGGRPELREMYNAWYQQIDIQDLVHMISHERWLSGQVIMNTTESKATKRKTPFRRIDDTQQTVDDIMTSVSEILNPNDEKDRKLMEVLSKRFGYELSKGGGVQEAHAASVVPTKYVVLDPLTLDIGGDVTDPTFFMRPDKDIKARILAKDSTRKQQDELIDRFGSDFVQDVKNNKRKARLNGAKLRTIFAKKPHYRHWGYIPGGSAIPYLQLKKRMRDLNLNTISQAIGYIVLVKIGSDTVPATKAMIQGMAKNWGQKPRKNPNPVLIQPHTTSIEIISPKAEFIALLSTEMYNTPNQQIAQAFGINLALITGLTSSGGGQSYSVASMGIRATIRRIIQAQMQIEAFLWKEHLRIAEVMKFDPKDIPKPKFLGTGLENFSEMAQVMFQAFDRGFPYKGYIESLGFQFDDILEQAKTEQEMGVDDLLAVRGAPTQKPGQVPDDDGRPPGTVPPNEDPNNESDDPSRTTESPASLNEIWEQEREKMEVR